MRRISYCLFMIIMMLITVNAFAKPGFIVTPFSKSLPLAINSTATVLVVAQNATGVNQTITNSVSIIPTDSGITGSVLNNTCGFLSPGSSCEVLVKLQSGNQPTQGNLNVAICSFNGTFCSRIVKPIDFSNTQPIKIFITPTNPSIANGTTKQFHATCLFANNTLQDVTNSVNWSSSDTSKASISNASGSEGLATGIAAGNSTISATLDGLSNSTTLTVTSETLTSITITPPNPSVPNGSTQQFAATGIYTDNSTQDLTSQVIWSSSNTAVATISNALDQKGLATTESVGGTTITATLGAISEQTMLNVTSADLTSISVTPTNPSVSIQTSQQFQATGIYSDSSVRDLTNIVNWSTQSSLVAIVSNQAGSKGNALGVGVGSTNVIATLGSITGSTNLNVTPAVLIGIDIAPTNIHLPAGSDQSYTATGIYDNSTNQDITTEVTWQSSDTNIASISNVQGSEGLAHAIQAGTVVISASLGSVAASTNLIVDTPTLLSITVEPPAPQLAQGAEQQFVAIGHYSDGSTRDLTQQATWTSSDPANVAVSNTTGSRGLATVSATAPPSTVGISATFNGVTSTAALISVTGAVLSSITVRPTNPEIPIGTTVQFSAIGLFFDPNNPPAFTRDITNEVTWISQFPSIATISNAPSTKGLATGVSPGLTTITAIESHVAASAGLSVNPVNIGDSFQGGIVGCLGGGLNNLIIANANNADNIVWGGQGTITNAQSLIDGGANTVAIVSVLGPAINYAAGLCDAYQIDSAGHNPCQSGNTCYNDWFLPANNQLSCLRDNQDHFKLLSDKYWGSTEDAQNPANNAYTLKFPHKTFPQPDRKTGAFSVRCARLINSLF